MIIYYKYINWIFVFYRYLDKKILIKSLYFIKLLSKLCFYRAIFCDKILICINVDVLVVHLQIRSCIVRLISRMHGISPCTSRTQKIESEFGSIRDRKFAYLPSGVDDGPLHRIEADDLIVRSTIYLKKKKKKYLYERETPQTKYSLSKIYHLILQLFSIFTAIIICRISR